MLNADMSNRVERACAFCGAMPPLTHEHIWPNWLRKELPSAEAHRHATRRREQGVEVHRREWDTPPYRFKVRAVCQRCNNGWMSAIDDAVKPWALPLIKGRGRALHSTGQLLLSKWAVLKTLMFDRTAAEPDRTVGRRFYDALHAARGLDDPLPPCFEVFIAHYGGSTVAAIAHTQPIEFRPDDQPREDSPLAGRDAYTATFTVAHLVLKVFGRDPDGIYEYQHARPISPSVRRIAPSRGSFIFPPGPSLTERGLSVVMGDKLVL